MHVLIQGGKLASFPTHCRTSLPLLSWDPVGSVLSLLPQKLCLTPRICPQIKITLSVLWPKGQGHNCSHRELHTPRLTFPCENEEILEISHEFSLWRWLKNGPPRLQQTTNTLGTRTEYQFMSLEVEPQQQLSTWLLQTQNTFSRLNERSLGAPLQPFEVNMATYFWIEGSVRIGSFFVQISSLRLHLVGRRDSHEWICGPEIPATLWPTVARVQ